jgi:hypothetical protein
VWAWRALSLGAAPEANNVPVKEALECGGAGAESSKGRVECVDRARSWSGWTLVLAISGDGADAQYVEEGNEDCPDEPENAAAFCVGGGVLNLCLVGAVRDHGGRVAKVAVLGEGIWGGDFAAENAQGEEKERLLIGDVRSKSAPRTRGGAE